MFQNTDSTHPSSFLPCSYPYSLLPRALCAEQPKIFFFLVFENRYSTLANQRGGDLWFEKLFLIGLPHVTSRLSSPFLFFFPHPLNRVPFNTHPLLSHFYSYLLSRTRKEKNFGRARAAGGVGFICVLQKRREISPFFHKNSFHPPTLSCGPLSPARVFFKL